MSEQFLKVGDLVKWNGDKSERIDKVVKVINSVFGGMEYYTEETNPKNGEEAKIGKQFFDYTGEYKDRGVGIVRA